MCRFLAYLTREPVAPAELLAEDALAAFVSLSREKKDGWGIGWRDEMNALCVAKAPEPAQGSEEFDRLAQTVRTDSLIMHLRWATLGFGLDLVDTHPFCRDGRGAVQGNGRGLAFAHNGAIKPVDGLEELVPAADREGLEGSTDSERYFLAMISALEREDDEEEALRELLRAVGERCSYTSLNCLLLTPERLYAICSYDPTHPDARYLLDRDADYFRLWYRSSPESFVVASTGWCAHGGWDTLGSGQALVVERGTLETRILEVA